MKLQQRVNFIIEVSVAKHSHQQAISELGCYKGSRYCVYLSYAQILIPQTSTKLQTI